MLAALRQQDAGEAIELMKGRLELEVQLGAAPVARQRRLLQGILRDAFDRDRILDRLCSGAAKKTSCPAVSSVVPSGRTAATSY